jgi:transcriptional regulator with XRE-family HTH domain
MKERILEFLRAENKSSAHLAEEIGVQPSGISHILSGRNNPSLDFILKMLDKYQFLSSEWLLFGKGNMYKEQSGQDLFADPEIITEKVNIDEKQPGSARYEPEKSQERTITAMKDKSGVEKIVWFYNDQTFIEYFPGKEPDKKSEL